MRYVIGVVIASVLVSVTFMFVSERQTELPDTQNRSAIDSTAATGIEHSVVLTNSGYVPADLSISVGDTIIFSADADYGRLHWPASNIHPSHQIYPEFDPLKPVEPEDTWSFVFTQIGEWRFHDHLAPYHTGVITVISADASE